MKIGPLYVGFCNQGAAAPFADRSTTITRCCDNDQEVARYHGFCFLLTPWRRNRYGESEPQKALVIALKK